MPTIGTVYCWNLMLTLFALCLHCIFHFLITILLPDTKCLPEQLKNLSSILNRFQAKELFVLSFDPQTLGSNNEFLPSNPSIPLEDTSDLNQSPQQFIIEMDPIIIETDSSNNAQLKLQQQQPSTSAAQFEAVELEEISQQQKTIVENPPSTTKSSTLKRTSSSKKSLLSFGSGVFKSNKESKNEKRIDAPFSINLNFEGEKEIENDEKNEEEDQQILINKEEKLEDAEERRKNILEVKKVVENKEEEKSILEKELMFLRQLIFYFYLIVSIILIFIIIF
uniref:Transmembrane protein n=1 Tax=Meloidogyne incognita TaxID=6306 RepID=A0A914NTD0_MELIC